MKRGSLSRSADLAAAAGLIALALGAAYRIALMGAIGVEAMAQFQYAYPAYLLLFAAMTTAVPQAVARLVARRAQKGDLAGARSIFLQCLVQLALFGAGAAAVIVVAGAVIAKLSGFSGANLALFVCAPSALFLSVSGAFRGYYQGRRLFAPPAIALAIEPVAKFALGLSFAASMAEKGADYAAMGAMIGVCGAELISLVVMLALYAFESPGRSVAKQAAPQNKASQAAVGRRFTSLGVSLALGGALWPLCCALDALIAAKRMEAAGFAAESARAAFAINQGTVEPLLFIHVLVAAGLAASLAPYVKAHIARKEYESARSAASTSAKLAVLLGLPGAVALAVLAEPLLSLFYGKTLTGDALAAAVDLLQVGAVSAFFLPVALTSSALLQGLRCEKIPAFNLAIALAVKVVAALVLIGRPELNIVGASASTALACGVLAILNTAQMARRAGLSLSGLDFAVKPAVASAFMGAALYFGYYGFLEGMRGLLMDLMIASLLALAVYSATLVLLKVFSKKDYAFLPGGQKALRKFTREGFYQ